MITLVTSRAYLNNDHKKFERHFENTKPDSGTQHLIFSLTYKWDQKDGVFQYTKLELLARKNTLAYWDHY
jgi:hypothetical protein